MRCFTRFAVKRATLTYPSIGTTLGSWKTESVIYARTVQNASDGDPSFIFSLLDRCGMDVSHAGQGMRMGGTVHLAIEKGKPSL
jgi:hypothetical protein